MVRGKPKDADGVEDKARRKLEKAALKLEVAQAKQTQARRKGKQEIEQAKLRAAAREARANQRVERRAAAVTRAQARLQEITGGDAPEAGSHDENATHSEPPYFGSNAGSDKRVTAAE